MCSSDLRLARLRGRRPALPPATRGCWKVGRERRGAGGVLVRAGNPSSGDQKRAALRGHVHAVPGMVQTMPMPASTPISHLRAPNEMRFASPCAK